MSTQYQHSTNESFFFTCLILFIELFNVGLLSFLLLDCLASLSPNDDTEYADLCLQPSPVSLTQGLYGECLRIFF